MDGTASLKSKFCHVSKSTIQVIYLQWSRPALIRIAFFFPPSLWSSLLESSCQLEVCPVPAALKLQFLRGSSSNEQMTAMTVIEPTSEGTCLSQKLSQVCLRTPVPQVNGWCESDSLRVGGAKPESAPEPDQDDYICSQDFFCTPDYITPVEQQFAVDLDPNKENAVPPECPPVGLTPMRGKRPRADGVGLDSWSLGPSTSAPEDTFAATWFGSGQASVPYIPPNSRLRLTALRQRALSPPCVRNPFIRGGKDDEDEEQGLQNPRFRARTAGHSMAAMGGNSLSRYRDEFHELEELGRGNFSKVFKVIKRIDGCSYAVKQSLRPLRLDSERRQALTEVQALAAVGYHQNVLRYYTSWFEADHLYIQTELCDGTLSDNKSDSSEKFLTDVMWQIASAVDHIHKHGVVHMDIKPSNIYLLKGVIKLGDFGRATRKDCSISVEEGDSRYLPLEILKDDYSDLPKADVFALGATIYELARGAPLPSSGPQFQSIRQGRLTLLPGFSLPFQNLLKSLMHPTPGMRPSVSSLLKHSIFRSTQAVVVKAASSV